MNWKLIVIVLFCSFTFAYIHCETNKEEISYTSIKCKVTGKEIEPVYNKQGEETDKNYLLKVRYIDHISDKYIVYQNSYRYVNRFSYYKHNINDNILLTSESDVYKENHESIVLIRIIYYFCTIVIVFVSVASYLEN